MSDEQHFFCGTHEPFSADLVKAWRKRTILWSVQGRLPTVSASQFREAVAGALASWEDVCGLRFAEAEAGVAPDVLITAARIDGPSQVLAWSELPDGSDRRLTQRYDTSEKYVVAERPARGMIDLVAVVCHEMGHALGLEHAPAGSGDLMAPTYAPGRRTPQPGDVARIQKLYGPAAPPVPTPSPVPAGPVVIRIWDASRVEVEGYEVRRKG